MHGLSVVHLRRATCRYEELKDIIKKTRNHKKIKDMAKILAGQYQPLSSLQFLIQITDVKLTGQ